ncbi:ArnT family glycosyltransferase [Sporolactobacillus kofuensis]|uniref:ArnT family glycosyltransferase n=1 Tax=Sporolactobacillus kofuensis TaxID=269672 RepID=A0ABW1WCF9_9BACL|nr:glycosyltransferase family 39 protein [Sporolactobacillus kofuensis]MCO7175988.1 glycosyltransferase family 39 protein [Sporolactobacillus kofuensis]
MNLVKNKRIDFYLLGVILFSAFMNLFLLNQAGTNEYYTVAVKSMMKNFHNFFYASFDPAGFITVDKPPVALWLQTLSAKLFGFHNFSVLLPEAIAAIISTVMIYQMVKHKAGKHAAFISGLTMSVTPIFVAVSRTNNVDSILILTLVIAAWAVIKAAATTKLRWLILSVAMVGLGFNVKMLEAFMILPAVYLFYWLAVKVNCKKKIIHLLTATVVLAALSLSWAVVVDSVPASKRPYIGSSQTNSVLELAFGYNGISRLMGQNGGGARPTSKMNQNNKALASLENGSNTNGFGQNRGKTSSSEGFFRGAGRQQSGGMFGTGTAGPLRLFSKELSGQASWLLPFVLLSLVAIVADWFKRRKLDEKHTFALFWLAWLAPAMAFFSVAGFFHHYYLSLMAPPIAALVGIGFSYMWQAFSDQKSAWRGYLLPIAFGVTCFFEAVILFQNNIGTLWVVLLIVAGILTSSFGFVWRMAERKVQGTIAGTSLFLIMLAPFYWTLPSTMNQTNSSIPVAGPSSTLSGMGRQQFSGSMSARKNGPSFPGGQASQQGNAKSKQSKFMGPGQPPTQSGSKRTNSQQPGAFSTYRMNRSQRGGGMDEQVNTKLLTYLRKHYNGEKYILAVERAQSAYSIMMKTNYAVMAMGGFQGNDPALSVSKLEKMVKNGEVKYFLIGSAGRSQNSSVMNWIKQHATKVPTSEWSNATSNQFGFDGQSTLYVLKK